MRRLLLLFFHGRDQYHTTKSCNTALSIARHLLLLKVRAHLAALRRRGGKAEEDDAHGRARLAAYLYTAQHACFVHTSIDNSPGLLHQHDHIVHIVHIIINTPTAYTKSSTCLLCLTTAQHARRCLPPSSIRLLP